MFGWVSPIISLAHRRGGLEVEDFPETPTYDLASSTTEALMRNFERVHHPGSTRTRGLSLAYAIALTFGWSWLASLVIFLTEAAMELVEVYTMGNIILFLQVHDAVIYPDRSLSYCLSRTTIHQSVFPRLHTTTQ